MFAGTLIGLFAGVVIAYPLSDYFGVDLLSVCMLAGIFAGWAAAFALGRLSRDRSSGRGF